MPVWMEVLVNLVGYAGFIALATLNRSAVDTDGVEPHRSGCTN